MGKESYGIAVLKQSAPNVSPNKSRPPGKENHHDLPPNKDKGNIAFLLSSDALAFALRLCDTL
jgi:hypothetical protein